MDWKRNGYWLEFKFGEWGWIKESWKPDQNVELKKKKESHNYAKKLFKKITEIKKKTQ